MRNLVIREQARLDLLEIWNFIAERSRDAADRVGEELEAAILDLLDAPGHGHVRIELASEKYRFWRVYSYLIAYRYDEEALTVVRVVHGSRDLRRFFRDNP
jgi:toxin ParE1/3/4